MLIEEKIAAIIEPVLEPMEFRLVRVSFSNGILQIMAEPFDENREMTVEDCAKISRNVSAVMDVEDPISSTYQLEISSPGLSRPLTRLEDYTRFSGELAKISVKKLIDDRRRFNGRLRGVTDDGEIIMDTSHGAVTIPYEIIESAKLDPSELLSKSLKSRKKG
jgi:ribosome maturation factor RimP